MALPGADLPHMVTAGHLIVPAAVMVYGYLGSMLRLVVTGHFVGMLGMTYVFQHWILEGGRQAARIGAASVPTSVMGWGEAAIGMAFVLLAAGAMMGLRRTARLEEPTRGNGAAPPGGLYN